MPPASYFFPNCFIMDLLLLHAHDRDTTITVIFFTIVNGGCLFLTLEVTTCNTLWHDVHPHPEQCTLSTTVPSELPCMVEPACLRPKLSQVQAPSRHGKYKYHHW